MTERPPCPRLGCNARGHHYHKLNPEDIYARAHRDDGPGSCEPNRYYTECYDTGAHVPEFVPVSENEVREGDYIRTVSDCDGVRVTREGRTHRRTAASRWVTRQDGYLGGAFNESYERREGHPLDMVVAVLRTVGTSEQHAVEILNVLGLGSE